MSKLEPQPVLPRRAWLLAALVISLGIAAPALAHHSFALYDQSRTVVLKGVVAKAEFTNPHGWYDLVVTDPRGQVSHWPIETSSPNQLLRQGWKSDSVKVGDTITVGVAPLKSGQIGGFLKYVILANGQKLGRD